MLSSEPPECWGREGIGLSVCRGFSEDWSPFPPPHSKPGPISSRETKGEMELRDLRDLLDPLGPGVLLATLGKMAPGGHKAQR